MSVETDLVATVLENIGFKEALAAIATRSVLADLPAIVPELGAQRVDWRQALLCASALTAVESEHGIDAALRVAQGALTDELAEPAHNEAAAVLLERMGNRRAIGLAEERALLGAEAWTNAPAPLRLDVIRRRIELTIPLADGEAIVANQFQRDFWSGAEEHGWLSVSAPTSAGKSYVLRRWFQERARASERFRGVYLVPTRALVDEVGRELRRELGDEVAVFSIPWDPTIGSHPKELYVLTQERLHLLQERHSAFALDLLFVDEAQKLGDESRGVLLQQVLDETLRRTPGAQVIFASPSSSNPQMLLAGAPGGSRPASLVSEAVTVNQNLLWVNSSPNSRSWTVELVRDSEPQRLGAVELPARPKTGQILPFLAAVLGGENAGNLVYVNGAADAEKVAMQIAELLADRVDLSEDEQIRALAELTVKTVHPDYRLIQVLQRGVGFHYGNMPTLVRAEIERLFGDGTLRYLVCTSTLLEGVNLPCRNLFVRGPKRGSGRPMSSSDFWNLAGRAGRWGKEFRGNIVCVDTLTGGWGTVPNRRVRQTLRRSSDEIISSAEALVAFIESPAPARAAHDAPVTASVFSLLATRVSQGHSLRSIPGVTLSERDGRDLEKRIAAVLEQVEVSAALMSRHAGISPTAMQVLLDYFRGHEPDTLPLRSPESPRSDLSYAKALSRCRDYLGSTYFNGDKRCAMLGILIRDWMQGRPMPRLITERMDYQRRSLAPNRFDPPRIIRETMEDVEQIARFAAPKYLACYQDVLALHLAKEGEKPAIPTETLTMMLELGVSSATEVSLMNLGISRAGAVAVSELMMADDLDGPQVLAWLRAQNVEQLAVPVLVRGELAELRSNASAT